MSGIGLSGRGRGGRGRGQGTQGQGGQGRQGTQGQGGQGQGRGGQNRPPKEHQPCLAGIVRGVVSGDTVLIINLDDAKKAVESGEPIKEIQLTLLGLKAPTLAKRSIQDEENSRTDKPYAWESREYLRKRVIGKAVVYHIEHENSGRYYGELWLDDENLRYSIVEEGWADILVRPNRVKRDDVDDEQTMLEEAKDKALSLNKGIHAGGYGHVRNVNYRDANRGGRGDDLFSFYERFKAKKLHGVVEQVLTGSSYRIYLPDTQDEITIQLAGVRCPMYRANNDFQSEPFSREARFVTEFYLLHRDVYVTLDSIDKTNNLYGTVVDNKGLNISLELLKRGYANFVAWSVSKSINPQQYKEAERVAQEAKLGIWSLKQLPTPVKDFEGKENERPQTQQRKQEGSKSESIVGQVVEIVKAGAINVRVNKGDKWVDRIINFSSIKTPSLPLPNTKRGQEIQQKQREQARERSQQYRDDLPRSKMDEDAYNRLEDERRKLEEAYAIEAKEWLRTNLIGKNVRCVFDYMRKTAPNDSEPKLFWSVYLETPNVSTPTNIAVELVSRGYATVVSHAKDEERSRDFQSLIIAEKAAKKASRGLHSPISKRPIIHVNDLATLDLSNTTPQEADKLKNQLGAKAKKYLSSLKREEKISAVVEHVYSSTRYKLRIPSEGFVINFSLRGLTTERPLRADQQVLPKNQKPIQIKPDMPFTKQFPPFTAANRAMLYARDNLYQRDVTIHVDNVDRAGTFLGHLFIGNKDFGLSLLETGNAKLMRKEDTSNPKLADTADEKAQNNQLGLYEPRRDSDAVEPSEHNKRAVVVRKPRGDDYVDPVKEAREQGRELNRVSEPFEVAITDVVDAVSFYFQKVGENTQALNDMMTNFQKQNWSSKQPIEPEKEGDYVAAQFTADNLWYRARIHNLIYPKKGDKKDKATQKPIAWDVEYIDYGNREVLKADRIRELPQSFNTKMLERQAHEGRLVYLKPPLEPEFTRDAAMYLKELVWDKQLKATQHFVPGKKSVAQLSLGDPQSKTSINAAMVVEGLARVQKFYNEKDTSKTAEFLRKLQEEENKARNARRNIWRHGDALNSDDERDDY